MSIQSVSWSDSSPTVPVSSPAPVQSSASLGSSKPTDLPENVFAPPGVFTRLTATLQAYHTDESARPSVVASGRELASNANYPSVAQLSAVASELLGGRPS